jgi:uncharacterized repeat protein (TIGR03803 family)
LSAGVPAQTRKALLYSFAGGSDGAGPQGNLIDVNGVLYGTTYFGGDANNDGTVFKITASGAESVLYRFKGGSDGAFPVAGLTDVNGVLYGTTTDGGAFNRGTVFKITTSGAETVLHSFEGGSDGSSPQGSLTDVNGVLYGAASGGDANDDGTVFRITTSGAESVLYRFAGGHDGANPFAGLTNVNGVLYGTTFVGGSPGGSGTVFEITTSGAEKVLHSFGGGNDGAYPVAALTDVNGVLYGTTSAGGAAGRQDGTVFKITTSGTETVLHTFGGGSDGRYPNAGLTNVNGVLYGTTVTGGGNYAGTVFKITTAGAKSAVYRFLGGSDGSEPYAGLTYADGVLYGATFVGGAQNHGTVFSLSL